MGLLGALGAGLAACSLDSDLPRRNGSATPANSGVTLSGAGAPDEIDAAVGYGEGSRISSIDDGRANRRASAGGTPGGTDRGGAFDESAEDAGGATSSEGGAAGAGGSAERTSPSPARGGAGATNNGSAGAGATKETPPKLWFSEYIEGSSSNKALEITAAKRSVLDGCKVGTYFNGKTEATVVATLSGVLEAGRVLTLCTSTLKGKLATACNQVGNLTFNGDDVVALSCDGKLLDVIGQIGVDPGLAWGSGSITTADHSLRRKCTQQNGDPQGSNAFDPSLEWQAFPVDTFDGLGTRGC